MTSSPSSPSGSRDGSFLNADPLAGHPTAIDCATMFGQTELADRLNLMLN